MSFNENHIISTSNYEEWFILYLDDELNAEQKSKVENFLLLHPHLREELDLLLGTKLPAEEVQFTGKEDLLASSMKLNVVDESLLLYLDNELTAAERKAVEEKLQTNADYRLQYDVLLQTKLDTSDAISYPDKKELYRHTEKVILFPVWMRIAVAVVLILFAATFFLSDEEKKPASSDVVLEMPKPTKQEKIAVPATTTPGDMIQQQQMATAKTNVKKEMPVLHQNTTEVLLPVTKESLPQVSAEKETVTAALPKVEVSQTKATKLTEQTKVALNNLIANPTVTSATVASYNLTEDPQESIVTDGDDKQPSKIPVRGFLRKVSRFIERRTGIGTVNADNELLIGAVSLKLN